jgi:hypothetical protein
MLFSTLSEAEVMSMTLPALVARVKPAIEFVRGDWRKRISWPGVEYVLIVGVVWKVWAISDGGNFVVYDLFKLRNATLSRCQ